MNKKGQLPPLPVLIVIAVILALVIVGLKLTGVNIGGVSKSIDAVGTLAQRAAMIGVKTLSEKTGGEALLNPLDPSSCKKQSFKPLCEAESKKPKWGTSISKMQKKLAQTIDPKQLNDFCRENYPSLYRIENPDTEKFFYSCNFTFAQSENDSLNKPLQIKLVNNASRVPFLEVKGHDSGKDFQVNFVSVGSSQGQINNQVTVEKTKRDTLANELGQIARLPDNAEKIKKALDFYNDHSTGFSTLFNQGVFFENFLVAFVFPAVKTETYPIDVQEGLKLKKKKIQYYDVSFNLIMDERFMSVLQSSSSSTDWKNAIKNTIQEVMPKQETSEPEHKVKQFHIGAVISPYPANNNSIYVLTADRQEISDEKNKKGICLNLRAGKPKQPIERFWESIQRKLVNATNYYNSNDEFGTCYDIDLSGVTTRGYFILVFNPGRIRGEDYLITEMKFASDVKFENPPLIVAHKKSDLVGIVEFPGLDYDTINTLQENQVINFDYAGTNIDYEIVNGRFLLKNIAEITSIDRLPADKFFQREVNMNFNLANLNGVNELNVRDAIFLSKAISTASGEQKNYLLKVAELFKIIKSNRDQGKKTYLETYDEPLEELPITEIVNGIILLQTGDYKETLESQSNTTGIPLELIKAIHDDPKFNVSVDYPSNGTLAFKLTLTSDKPEDFGFESEITNKEPSK